MLGQFAEKGYQQVPTDQSSSFAREDLEELEEEQEKPGCCRCGPGWVRFGVIVVMLAVAAVLAYTAIKQPVDHEITPVRIAVLNASIWTGDPHNPWVDAMGIEGTRVVILGSVQQVSDWAESFENSADNGHLHRIDGNSRTRLVTPGFHDSHCHPAASEIENSFCVLLGSTSQQEILDRITYYAMNHSVADRGWIYGSGWELTMFPDANPSKTLLDDITAIQGRPAMIVSADAHSCWVNSKTLELAGITAATPDPPHGRIERDAHGNPTGTLREAAVGMIQRIMPPWPASSWRSAARTAISRFNSVGITSLQDAGCSEEILAAYHSLDTKAQLTATVVCSQYASPNKSVSQQIGEMRALRDKYQSAHLIIPTAKIFVDGVIEARTAALLEPYEGSTTDRGMTNYSPQFLNELVDGLITAGFQVHCHAIGDRAVRMALDAYENAGEKARGGRHHIAHLELIHPDDIGRFRKLGVVANFQPFWAFNDTYMSELTVPLIGLKRASYLYNFRSVVNTGATVVAGSDWAVSSMNPLDGMQVGLMRQPLDGSLPQLGHDQTLQLPTLAAMYTSAGAYGSHLEATSGDLRLNQLANFVMFDRNWFDGAPLDIHNAKALCTYFEGKLVYGSC